MKISRDIKIILLSGCVSLLLWGLIEWSEDAHRAEERKQQISAIAENIQEKAAALKIPTTAELRKEQMEANAHVTPSSKMLWLIYDTNKTFRKLVNVEPLSDCHRTGNHEYSCRFTFGKILGTARILSNIMIQISASINADNQYIALRRITIPMLTVFMPTAPTSLIHERGRIFSKRAASATHASAGLGGFYGTIAVRSWPNRMRVTINGSSSRPWVNGHYVMSYK